MNIFKKYSIVLLNVSLLGISTIAVATEKVGKGKTVLYTQGQAEFEGKFFSSKKANAPLLVLVHNWIGISPETEKQAIRYQSLGYNVFLADIYGKGIRPNTMEAAAKEATKYKSNRTLFRERIRLAIDKAQEISKAKTEKTAIMGYCFGGTAAIESARNGDPIAGAVSFHGGLDSQSEDNASKITAKVLAFHGAIDPYVPAKDLNAFEAEMQKAKVDYELIKYANTVHSFTDESAGSDISKGAAYNAESDEKSFERTKLFLQRLFK